MIDREFFWTLLYLSGFNSNFGAYSYTQLRFGTIRFLHFEQVYNRLDPDWVHARPKFESGKEMIYPHPYPYPIRTQELNPILSFLPYKKVSLAFGVFNKLNHQGEISHLII